MADALRKGSTRSRSDSRKGQRMVRMVRMVCMVQKVCLFCMVWKVCFVCMVRMSFVVYQFSENFRS